MEVAAILILILSFFILLAMGVPVAFCLGLSAAFTMFAGIMPIPALSTVAQKVATGIDSFSLLAIPFFILAGQFMNKGGIASRLIEFAKVIVGRLPGGLAFVNILANMLFGAVSGSAVAAASAIGGTMGPRMEEEGYDKPYSAAVNISSATTGMLIPPSNILIVYSLASGGVSIGALFVAGYIPGIMVGLFLMVVAGYFAYKKNYPTAGKVTVSEAFYRFFDAIPSLLILIIVIGGIITGLFTATEASAVAVLYTFVLSVFIYREIKFNQIPQLLLNAVVTTSIVMLLVGTSIAMSWVMSFESIPQTISAALLGLTENKIVIYLLINVILLVVGTFMDMTPAVLIFTPIFLPVATSLGMDPVHFGILLILNLSIGLCTPPVGTVLFVGSAVANIGIERVIKPLLPLFISMLFALMLVTYIPEITLTLPKLFGVLD